MMGISNRWLTISIQQGCTLHGAAFFCFGAGRGGAEEKNFGAGQGGAGRKCSGRGGVTVKPRGIFRVGRGILENFRGRGAPGQPFPPGSGWGGAGCASLNQMTQYTPSYGIYGNGWKNHNKCARRTWLGHFKMGEHQGKCRGLHLM